jgi:SWI/SNF chromatin-remodeling complex subunit SWI1
LTQERVWPSIALAFDLPETYVLNGAPTAVAQLLGQYYKAILLPFEELARKQRPTMGMQGQAGQAQQTGQHSMIPSQIPVGDVGAQGVVPPTIPHMDSGSAPPPHHGFPSSQAQRQPSVGMSGPSLRSPDMLSGVGSNISQPFLSQASPDGSQLSLHGQAQDGPLDADAEGRKRKGAPEVDAKRVRQRTGMSNSYPITVRTNQEGFQKSILQIQQWSVIFLFREMY